jgi:hypothetical protein
MKKYKKKEVSAIRWLKGQIIFTTRYLAKGSRKMGSVCQKVSAKEKEKKKCWFNK